jgi:hypothetical protein
MEAGIVTRFASDNCCFGAGSPQAVRPSYSHHTDPRLSDDYLAPLSDDFAQRAGPVDMTACHYRLPSNTRTIVRNDLVADHPEAAHLKFGRKLSGSHV